MAQYEIKHCPVRQRRGLAPWGVFENKSDALSIGVSQHHTKEEAEAALAALKNKDAQ